MSISRIWKGDCSWEVADKREKKKELAARDSVAAQHQPKEVSISVMEHGPLVGASTFWI